MKRLGAYTTRIIGVVIFVCAAALYIRTTAPTLGGAFDSEEFQFAAYHLDIVHATGYPLYLILGKIFTTLVPIGNIAYRMNLLSAILSAFTAVLVYLNALILTRRQIASIATAALFATNTAVWRQAGVASVSPLHLLLIAAIVYAMLLWHDKPGFREAKKPGLSIAAFLFGLGLAHHRTTLWLAPPIAILVLLDDPEILRRPRDIAKNLFWLALPLLLYLYLPIFGHNSPWYSNTLSGFLAQVTGGDAGDYLRTSPTQMLEGITITSQYLLDSFGYLGLMLVIVGAVSRIQKPREADRSQNLFLGLATLIFSAWGALYAGEPDRYLVMPFMFLIYWFAIGVGTLQNYLPTPKSESRNLSFIFRLSSFILSIILVVFLALPFPDHFHVADWSAFDRTYKLWGEVFTLPIPQNATIVGNWGQLNAMRYMQRIEHRRTDLQLVGTLYDTTPQTQATQAAFADGRAIFLAPSVAQPDGDYRYALLGPLLQVYDKSQTQAPANAKDISINPSLTLADYTVTTALEPFAPTTSIAPNRTARVSLTWLANNPPNNFIVRIDLYDPESRLIARKDEAPVRGLYPVLQWQRGEFVNDVHNLLIPAGSPPGKYPLKLQTIDADTKQSTSDEITLASLNIERVTNITVDQVFIAHPLNIDLGKGIELWGYGGLEGHYHAGETIGASLVYSARENVNTDLTLHLALIDSSGKIGTEWQRAPISFYPTSQWQKGEILKASYDLPLPNNLPVGEYSVAISFGNNPIQFSNIQIVP